MSFLEMLDVLNEDLIKKGEDPIAFDSDCREGICGTCGLMVNGMPHGPEPRHHLCQLHMRRFKDGDTITIEPWRARAFPVIKDLVVDRTRLRPHHPARRLRVGQRRRRRPDGNAIPIPQDVADQAMDAAQCIGCGACVAACKNASAALFTSAQGHPPGPAAAGPGPSGAPRRPHGRADGRGGLRRLLERRRVRSGVPEGDLDCRASRA